MRERRALAEAAKSNHSSIESLLSVSSAQTIESVHANSERDRNRTFDPLLTAAGMMLGGGAMAMTGRPTATQQQLTASPTPVVDGMATFNFSPFSPFVPVTPASPSVGQLSAFAPYNSLSMGMFYPQQPVGAIADQAVQPQPQQQQQQQQKVSTAKQQRLLLQQQRQQLKQEQEHEQEAVATLASGGLDPHAASAFLFDFPKNGPAPFNPGHILHNKKPSGRVLAQMRCTGKAPRTIAAGGKSLASCFPEIALDWHPVLNGNVSPDQVAPKACRKVWWRCARNPTHEWAARIDNRTRRGQKCPFCTKINN